MSQRVIYKYPFEVSDDVRIQMPSGADILRVELQGRTPTLWALVNPNGKAVEWRFRVIGTGHPFETDGLQFVDTFQQPPFVWHLFQVISK